MNTPQVIAGKGAQDRYNVAASTGTLKNTRGIGRVGSVANRGQLESMSSLMPDTITATYDNTGSSTDVTLMIFDPNAIVAGVLGGSYVSPSWGSGLSNSLVKTYFSSNPATFKGFNYRVTTGTDAQFSNAVKYHKVAVDGSSVTRPANIGQFIRNTQQNTTVQTIDAGFAIDQLSALTIVVSGGAAIALDFYFGEILNSLI